MRADAFRDGLDELKRLTLRGPVAAMCAEGNPWRCHRNLLADALLACALGAARCALGAGRWALGAGRWTLDAGRWTLDADMRELAAPGKWKQHELIPFARVHGRKVTYPLSAERPGPLTAFSAAESGLHFRPS